MRGNTGIIKPVFVGPGKANINPSAFIGKTFTEFKAMYNGALDVEKAFEKVTAELAKIQKVKPKVEANKPRARKRPEKDQES